MDRLPIYVSGGGIEKLLSIPELPDGTGKSVAAGAKKAVDDWNLKERITAMCFDTIASNTGERAGACHLFEEQLCKSSLYLPCRHHILEVIVGHAFQIYTPGSSGPDIQLFKRFRDTRSSLNVQKYETAYDDKETSAILFSHCSNIDEVVQFAEHALASHYPRGDYKEFLQLIVFLCKKLHEVEYDL